MVEIKPSFRDYGNSFPTHQQFGAVQRSLNCQEDTHSLKRKEVWYLFVGIAELWSSSVLSEVTYDTMIINLFQSCRFFMVQIRNLPDIAWKSHIHIESSYHD
ncbi:unnamed protein product, partial [Schistosoma intercalatum]